MTKKTKKPPDGEQRADLDYLLELTRALIGQTPIGHGWPEVVRVRAPSGAQETHILASWRDIIAEERGGTPLAVVHDTLH